jgi:uncharacterized SAM-binding protein YcdF (DUF218 family)
MGLRGIAVLCAAALTSGCYTLALTDARKRIVSQGIPPRCDVILVPGCPAQPDGQPSTCIRRRVRAAVDAFLEGAAERILFSGGASHNAANEALAMARYARTLGVPESRILIEPRARHTVENLRFAALMLVPRGWRRVLIVTDVLQLPYMLMLVPPKGLILWGRLAHPPFSAEVARRQIPRDPLEPVPRPFWF